MTAELPTTTTARTAAEVCRQVQLPEPASRLLREGQGPMEFLEALLAHGQFPAAVHFLAHALPRREAVWWACLCARHGHGAAQPSEASAALQSAERWAREPAEEHRRAAWPAAEAAGLGTPAGCAASAAFFSGGSLAPPSAPAVPPGEWLTARAAAGAVLLAAVGAEPAKAPDKFRTFLALGKAVASGANRWPAGGSGEGGLRAPV
jgi:hypothetical protein